MSTYKNIIEKFNPSAGYHCVSNSFKQIFDYYKCPLTEEMIFGLGQGLNFFILKINMPLIRLLEELKMTRLGVKPQ